jgi:hypothetical protein
MACVAQGFAYITISGAVSYVPMAYVYLDRSLTSETWYYIYRYILANLSTVRSTAGPYGGPRGPMSLISEDPSTPPPYGAIRCYLPPANPNLVQVSTGQAPDILLPR